MEYRNIFVANPAKLSLRRHQLVITQEEERTLPLEDVSSLLIESPLVSVTAAALSAMADNGITVFFCDEKHMPAAQLLPMNQFCRQHKLLTAQCSMPRPQIKQLWQKIVIRKIKNQARCLELMEREQSAELKAMAASVLSDDSDNREAVAAAKYFPALFGKAFTREDPEDGRNSALNYGYAILRGAMARNLVTHGLEPALGIHHCSELNRFNLADDMMEPFRPLVDLYVAQNVSPEETELSRQLKCALFNLTNYLVLQADKKYRVMTAVGKSGASLASCIVSGGTELELPWLLPLEEHRYE